MTDYDTIRDAFFDDIDKFEAVAPWFAAILQSGVIQNHSDPNDVLNMLRTAWLLEHARRAAKGR